MNEIPYKVVRSKRKTTSITVDRQGEVIVRAPLRESNEQIALIVQRHEAWIARTVERVKARPAYPEDAESIAALKKKAQEVLFPLVQKYSSLMNLHPDFVKIGSAKTRFGCCTSEKHIIFSCYLMLYPEKAIEYVVVHELAHLRYMNHGKHFYALIGKYLPDYKERIKLLNNK